jgi:hypothetical protein
LFYLEFYHADHTRIVSEAVRSTQKDISLLKNMILTRFDCMDCAMTHLAASVSQVFDAREKKYLPQHLTHSNQLQQQSITTSTTKTNGYHTEKARTCSSPQNLARCDPQSSDDLFRSDMSPSTRRSSRLASRSAL